MSVLIDLTGQRFGKLSVMNRANNTMTGQTRWDCRCDCGNKKIINGSDLKSGKTRSCGCFQKETIKNINTIHGHKQRGKGSKIYVAWRSMLDRCNDSKNKRYKDYGERGITVCDRWNTKRGGCFKNFLEDMGEPPTHKHQIDRIDNNKLINGYSPKNCRWVLPKENCRNKRNNKLYTYNGKTQCLIRWAEEYNIKIGTLWARLYVLNWPIEKALLTPIKT